ncbi:hypothetical protein [Parasutterella sp.]|uniref:hypothetical protein n=1 Tax=Parasutterella sp. TaxID=2049037 RepID=UPI0035224402
MIAVGLRSVKFDLGSVEDAARHDIDGRIAVDHACDNLRQIVFIVGLNLRRILVINHRSLIAAGDVNGVIAEEAGNVTFGIADFGSIKNTAL